MDQDEEGPSQGQGEGQRRLEKVLKNSNDLISLSQALQQQSHTELMALSQGQPTTHLVGPSPILNEEAAVPSLTAGGILTLQRILAKLSNVELSNTVCTAKSTE